MIVQEVSAVEVATEPELEYSSKLAFEMLLGGKIEACSHYGDRVVACEYHPFVAAVHSAYAEHRPLVLSPDMFWLLVAQGFANHVNMNSEAMRHHFVQFGGKKKVVVRRDQFIKGSLENDWAGAYNEFAGKLVEFIGKENHDRIVCPFSTTGLVERAANDLVLTDAMQSCFELGMYSMCGIPSVTLEGTAEDWSKLHDKTEELGKAYDVKWWTDKLLPIMERIARNAAGADDPDLWQRIYKVDNSSGGPYIGGWIRRFFPYINGHDLSNCKSYADVRQARKIIVRNKWLDADDEPKMFSGMSTADFPASLSKVPLTWNCLGQIFEMQMLAGFACYTQDKETRAVRPKIGWAVRDVGVVPISRREWWAEAAREGAVPDYVVNWLKQ
jgi:hypothetical protein